MIMTIRIDGEATNYNIKESEADTIKKFLNLGIDDTLFDCGIHIDFTDNVDIIDF